MSALKSEIKEPLGRTISLTDTTYKTQSYTDKTILILIYGINLTDPENSSLYNCMSICISPNSPDIVRPPSCAIV